MGKRGKKATPWQERIEKYFERGEGCWLWEGRVSFGSPVYSPTSSGARSARVMVFVLTYGDVPPGKLLKPQCGNRLCVKPDHMGYSMSREDRDEICRRWALHLKHKTTLEELGMEFGVTRQRIEQIVKAEEA